jgi:hypothetical protein
VVIGVAVVVSCPVMSSRSDLKKAELPLPPSLRIWRSLPFSSQ